MIYIHIIILNIVSIVFLHFLQQKLATFLLNSIYHCIVLLILEFLKNSFSYHSIFSIYKRPSKIAKSLLIIFLEENWIIFRDIRWLGRKPKFNKLFSLLSTYYYPYLITDIRALVFSILLLIDYAEKGSLWTLLTAVKKIFFDLDSSLGISIVLLLNWIACYWAIFWVLIDTFFYIWDIFMSHLLLLRDFYAFYNKKMLLSLIIPYS